MKLKGDSMGQVTYTSLGLSKSKPSQMNAVCNYDQLTHTTFSQIFAATLDRVELAMKVKVIFPAVILTMLLIVLLEYLVAKVSVSTLIIP